MTRYTSSCTPFSRYNTTNSPTVLVGPRPAQLLNVAKDTRKEMAKATRHDSLNIHSDSGVPSSYSWKPTKPLIIRQVIRADERPFCTATKYGKGSEPGGTTPASTHRDMNVRSM